MWAQDSFSLGIRHGISLKRVVFICIYTIVLVIPVGVPVPLLVVAFLRTPPSPTMLLACQCTFPKRLVSTCSIFKNNSFDCLWEFLASEIFSRNSLPKKIFIFCWSSSDLFFNMDFAYMKLFIKWSKAPGFLKYDRAMFVCPASIILWVGNFIKSSIETDESCSFFAVPKLSLTYTAAP